MIKDNLKRLSTVNSIPFISRTATVNGSGVDLKGYESATLVATMGAWAGNQGTWVFTTGESDDNSTFTTVDADVDIIGTEPTLSGQINRVFGEWGYKGTSRYIRATATLTGGGTATYFGVNVVRGSKRHGPPTAAS